MDSTSNNKPSVSETRELTHEDVVYMKKCRDEAFLYGQIPLTGLFAGIVWYRHNAGYYNHLSFAAVVGRYLFALSSGVVVGMAAYLPFCMSRVTSSDMVDSVLQDQILQQRSSRNLDVNSRLKVPSAGPNEPFRDPFLEAVKPSDGFTTYMQRREFSRQLLLRQQQQQPQQAASSATASVDDRQQDVPFTWQ